MTTKTIIQLPSAFDFLKEAWELLREHSQLLLKLVAVVYVPVNTILYVISLNTNADGWEGLSDQARFSNLLEFVLGTVVTIGAIYIVGLSKGVKLAPVTTFNELLHEAGNKYQVTLRAIGRSAILLLLLSLLFIIPGIIYGVYWAFVIPIAVLTDKKGGDILKASKELVQGRWWTILGYSFAFGIAGLLVAIVASIPTILLPESIAWFSIVTNLVIDFASLLPIMAGTLLYLKLQEIGPIADTSANKK